MALCRSGIPCVAHHVGGHVDATVRLAGLRSRAEGRAGPTRLFHGGRHAQPRRGPCHLADDRLANDLSQIMLCDLHCLISLSDTKYLSPRAHTHDQIEVLP